MSPVSCRPVLFHVWIPRSKNHWGPPWTLAIRWLPCSKPCNGFLLKLEWNPRPLLWLTKPCAIWPPFTSPVPTRLQLWWPSFCSSSIFLFSYSSLCLNCPSSQLSHGWFPVIQVQRQCHLSRNLPHLPYLTRATFLLLNPHWGFKKETNYMSNLA